MPRRWPDCLLALVAWLAVTEACLAHGFGQRYDLPIPLAHYLWGAGATVAFSFVIFAVFLKTDLGPAPVLLVPLRGIWRALAHARAASVHAVGVGRFLTVVRGGTFCGDKPLQET